MMPSAQTVKLAIAASWAVLATLVTLLLAAPTHSQTPLRPSLPAVRRTDIATDADGRAVIWTGAVSYSVISSGPEQSETCRCGRGDTALLAQSSHRTDWWCGWGNSNSNGRIRSGGGGNRTWRSCGACLTMCRRDGDRGGGGALDRPALDGGAGSDAGLPTLPARLASPLLPGPGMPSSASSPGAAPAPTASGTGGSSSAGAVGAGFAAVLEQRRLAPPALAAVCVQKPPEVFTDRRVIEYFVQYYLARGFGEVTLYTWDRALAWDIPGAHWLVVPYVEKTEHFNRHQQLWVQVHCLHYHKAAGTQWVLSLDLDEFVAPLSKIQTLLTGAEPRHSYSFGQWRMDGPQFPVTVWPEIAAATELEHEGGHRLGGTHVTKRHRGRLKMRTTQNGQVGARQRSRPGPPGEEDAAVAVATLAFYTKHLGSGNISAIPVLALSPCDPWQDGRPDPRCSALAVVGCNLCPGSPGKRKQLLNVTAACMPYIHSAGLDELEAHLALCSGPGVIEHLDAGFLGFVHFRGLGRFVCPDGLSSEACDAIFVPDLRGIDSPRRPSLTSRLWTGPAHYYYNGTQLRGGAVNKSTGTNDSPAKKKRRRKKKKKKTTTWGRGRTEHGP